MDLHGQDCQAGRNIGFVRPNHWRNISDNDPSTCADHQSMFQLLVQTSNLKQQSNDAMKHQAPHHFQFKFSSLFSNYLLPPHSLVDLQCIWTLLKKMNNTLPPTASGTSPFDIIGNGGVPVSLNNLVWTCLATSASLYSISCNILRLSSAEK